jgi:hypothetical protein
MTKHNTQTTLTNNQHAPRPKKNNQTNKQILMGTMVTFFFSGFVMGRVPFGLSPRFRPMLQRGVDLASLDVAYFTGLSYYIMLLFASQGPFSLAFADATVDQAQLMMRQQMAMGAPGPGGAQFCCFGV